MRIAQWRQLDSSVSPEHMLYSAFARNHVTRRTTRVVFFKVRANCDVSWQGIKAHRGRHRFDHLDLNATRTARVQATYVALRDHLRRREAPCSCAPALPAGVLSDVLSSVPHLPPGHPRANQAFTDGDLALGSRMSCAEWSACWRFNDSILSSYR